MLLLGSSTRLALWTGLAGAAAVGSMAGCGGDSPRTVTETIRERTTTVERTVTASPPPTTQTRPERPGGNISDAVDRVQREGYDVVDRSGYDPNATLRVLIGVRHGSADGYAKKAFFFVGPEFIGTDTKDPSAGISVESQTDTTVTLGYAIYRRNDGLCCPSGGTRSVRYSWDGARLSPQDPIPSLAQRGQA